MPRRREPEELSIESDGPWISSAILRGKGNGDQKVAIVLRGHEPLDGYTTKILTDRKMSVTAMFSPKALAKANEEDALRFGDIYSRVWRRWTLMLRKFEIQHRPSLLKCAGEFMVLVDDFSVTSDEEDSSLRIADIIPCMTVPEVQALAWTKTNKSRNVNLRSHCGQFSDSVRNQGGQSSANTVRNQGGQSVNTVRNQGGQSVNTVRNQGGQSVKYVRNQGGQSVNTVQSQSGIPGTGTGTEEQSGQHNDILQYFDSEENGSLSDLINCLTQPSDSDSDENVLSLDVVLDHIQSQGNHSDSSVSVSDLLKMSAASLSESLQSVAGVERHTGAVGIVWPVPHNRSQCPDDVSGPSCAATKQGKCLRTGVLDPLKEKLRQPFTVSEFVIPESQQELLDQIKDYSSPSPSLQEASNVLVAASRSPSPSLQEAADVILAGTSESSFNIGSENTLRSQAGVVIHNKRIVNEENRDDGHRSRTSRKKQRADVDMGGQRSGVDRSGGRRSSEDQGGGLASSSHGNHSDGSYHSHLQGQTSGSPSGRKSLMLNSKSFRLDSPMLHSTQKGSVTVQRGNGNVYEYIGEFENGGVGKLELEKMMYTGEGYSRETRSGVPVTSLSRHSDATSVSNNAVSEGKNATGMSLDNLVSRNSNQLSGLHQVKRGTLLSGRGSSIGNKLKDSPVKTLNVHVRQVLQSEHDRLTDLCNPEYFNPMPLSGRPAVDDSLGTNKPDCDAVPERAAQSTSTNVEKGLRSSTKSSSISISIESTQKEGSLYMEKNGGTAEKKGDIARKKGDNAEKKGDNVEKKGDNARKKEDTAGKKGETAGKKGDNVGTKEGNADMLVKTSSADIDDTHNSNEEQVLLQAYYSYQETNTDIQSCSMNKGKKKDQNFLSGKYSAVPAIQPSNNTRTDQDNVTRTDQDNVTRTDQENVTRTDQDNVTRTDQDNVTRTDQDNVTRTDQDNVTRTDQDNVTRTDQDNVTRTDQDNVTRTDQDNVTRTDTDNVTRTDTENVTRTDQDNVTRTDQDNVTRTDQDNVTRTEVCILSQSGDADYPDSETTNGWESDSVQLADSQDHTADMTNLESINNYHIDHLKKCTDSNVCTVHESVKDNKQSLPEDTTESGNKVRVQDGALQLENMGTNAIKDNSGDAYVSTDEVTERSKTDSRPKLTLKIKTAQCHISNSKKLTLKTPTEFDSEKRCKRKSKELRNKVLAARAKDIQLSSNSSQGINNLGDQFTVSIEAQLNHQDVRIVAQKPETVDLTNVNKISADSNAKSEAASISSKESVKLRSSDNSGNGVSRPRTRSGSSIAVKNTQKKFQGCRKLIVVLHDIAKQLKKVGVAMPQTPARIVEDSNGTAGSCNSNKEREDKTKSSASGSEHTEIHHEPSSNMLETDARNLNRVIDKNTETDGIVSDQNIGRANNMLETDARNLNRDVDKSTETDGIVSDQNIGRDNSADSNNVFGTQSFNPVDETQGFSPELIRSQSHTLEYISEHTSPSAIVSLKNKSSPTQSASSGVKSCVRTTRSGKRLSNDTVDKANSLKDETATDTNSACIDNIEESNKGVFQHVNTGDTGSKVILSRIRHVHPYTPVCEETKYTGKLDVFSGKETKQVNISSYGKFGDGGEQHNSRIHTHDRKENDVDTNREQCHRTRYESQCGINTMEHVTNKTQTKRTKQDVQATDMEKQIILDSTFAGTCSIPDVEGRKPGASVTNTSGETVEKLLSRKELEKLSQSSEECTPEAVDDAKHDVPMQSNSLTFRDKFNLRGFKERKRKPTDKEVKDSTILKGFKKRKVMSVKEKNDFTVKSAKDVQSKVVPKSANVIECIERSPAEPAVHDDYLDIYESPEILTSSPEVISPKQIPTCSKLPTTKPVSGELVRKQKDGIYRFVRVSKQDRVRESKQDHAGTSKQDGVGESKQDGPEGEAEDCSEDEDQSPSLLSGVRRKPDRNTHEMIEIIDYSLPSYQPGTSSVMQEVKGNNSDEEEEDNSVIVISSGESSNSLSGAELYWKTFLSSLNPDLATDAGRKIDRIRNSFAFK